MPIPVLVQISLAVIALAVAAVAAYLIPTLKQAQQTAKQIQQTAGTLDQTIKEIKPILELTEQTLRDISEVTSSMKKQAVKMENSIENYRNLIDRAQKLSTLVYDQIENPIIRTLNNINAFRSGFKTFFSTIISKKKEE